MKSLATYEITDRVRFIRRGWADVGATGTVVANSHLNLGTLIIKLDERGPLIEAHRDWLIMFRIEDGYFAMATEEDVEPISSDPIESLALPRRLQATGQCDSCARRDRQQ